ncbi:MAG: hypothetical protein LH613_09595 [Chamaesiphon sp.]|nr:hypothetical protein [Chamaesiphon sp.]
MAREAVDRMWEIALTQLLYTCGEGCFRTIANFDRHILRSDVDVATTHLANP